MSIDTVDKQAHLIDRKAAAQILSISQRTLDRYIKQKRVYSRKSNGRVWLDKEDILRFKKKRSSEILEDVNQMNRRHKDLNSDEKSGIINIDTSRQAVSTSVSSLSIPDSEIEEKIDVLSDLVQQVLHNDKTQKSGVTSVTTVPQNSDQTINSTTTQSASHTTSQSGAYQVQDSYGNTFLYTPLQYAPQQHVPTPYDQGAGQLNQYYSEGIYQKLYEELKAEHKVNQKRIEAANYKVGQLEAQLETMIPLLDYKKQQAKYKKLESGLRTEVKKRELQLKKARRMLNSEKLNKWVFAVLALGLIAAQPIIWLMQR